MWTSKYNFYKIEITKYNYCLVKKKLLPYTSIINNGITEYYWYKKTVHKIMCCKQFKHVKSIILK